MSVKQKLLKYPTAQKKKKNIAGCLLNPNVINVNNK